MPKLPPRAWQEEAYSRWQANSRTGIISVVTGGGKTVFALTCIDRIKPDTTLIVVPTVALLDQWWAEIAAYFDVDLDEIHVVRGQSGLVRGTVNLAVLNTASKILQSGRARESFLIVDECHKAASERFRTALDVPKFASLGLSATPDRQYDQGLADVLVPALGPVIYEYSYRDALRDGVIVPFALKNIVFDLEEDRREEYDKLTKSIARSISKNGLEAEETIALMLRRARVLNLSLERVRIALKLVAANRGKKILVFHEDIDACNLIFDVLVQHGVKAGLYHSKAPPQGSRLDAGGLQARESRHACHLPRARRRLQRSRDRDRYHCRKHRHATSENSAAWPNTTSVEPKGRRHDLHTCGNGAGDRKAQSRRRSS